MSKKKKGKVVQLRPGQQSPENYIKTQARTLPIAECLVSEDWEEVGFCNILVARSHTNGNFTVGVYHVDLYCLGVTDAWYEFNISDEDYEEMKDGLVDILDECEYTLAHNVIYGAVAYAEDYGFKPQKGFEAAQFILEEDDDRVELLEIEFGSEGKPFYATSPYDDANEAKRVKATLDRTAGPGNYVFKELTEEDFNISDEEWDEIMDDEDWDGEDEDEMEQDGETMEDLLRALKVTSDAYEKIFREPEASARIKNSTIGKGYRLSDSSKKMDQNTFDSPEQEKQYVTLLDTFNNREFKKAAKGLGKAILQYPDKPQFYTLLQGCYFFDGETEKMDASVEDMYQRFPHYLFAKVPYANMLISAGKPGEIPAVFEGKTDLNNLYPDRKTFHSHEAAVFLATMCRYYVAVDDIDSADPYMNVILKKKLWDLTAEMMVQKAMVELYHAKTKKIRDYLGWK